MGLLVFFVIADSGVIDWKLVVTLVGLTVSLIFFVQKQKLEELKLFKELFTEFNRRYDEMNGR